MRFAARPTARVRITPLIIAIQALIASATAALGVLVAASGIDAGAFVYPVCVLLGLQAVWALWSWQKVTGTLRDPYVLFLLAALLFNGGQGLLEVLGLNESGILGGRFPPSVVVQVLLMVGTSLSALHLGALLAVARQGRSLGQARDLAALSSDYQRGLRITGWLLLAVAIAPAIVLLKDAVSVVLAQGYQGLYLREPSAGPGSTIQALAAFVTPATFFLIVGGRGRKGTLVIALAVLLGYCGVLLFLGYRGHSVMPLVAAGWLWHRCVRAVPRPVLWGGAAIMLFAVFPLVRTTRNVSGADRLSFSFIQDALASIDDPVISIISEMGGSMGTIAYTVELVPAERDFDRGVGYLYSLLTPLPNLFWDVHPTVARGTPDSWLINTVDPFAARAGWGLGYSFIAEAYLNFGWLGPTFGMVLFGFAYVAFWLWAERARGPAKLAAVACFIPSALFFVRADSTMLVRPLVWYSLGSYLLFRTVRYIQTGTARRL